MRAQNKETLQSIIDNTELSEEEKSDAVAQMVELTKQSETEMEIETLMATKGFSEAVVSLGEDSADVVVNAEELTDANRAQIVGYCDKKVGCKAGEDCNYTNSLNRKYIFGKTFYKRFAVREDL